MRIKSDDANPRPSISAAESIVVSSITPDSAAKLLLARAAVSARPSENSDGTTPFIRRKDAGAAKAAETALTVADGVMTIHVVLVSKNIVNLFPGLAEDAEKEGAALLEPTTDTVNYNDGTTGEVYGFDIPVPVIGEEFDCALLGKKGKWYDHKVMVSNPVPVEAE